MTPGAWAALAFAAPLAGAALIGAGGAWLPRRAVEAIAIAAAAFALAASVVVTLAATSAGSAIEWFGGWTPAHGVALGIAFVADPVGAAFATFVSLLTTAALVYAWSYYDEGGPPFYVLMLLFLGALVGFFLTGDLFNMFVFFELMGVAAYALTAYRSEDESAVEGALSFAVINSVGAFLILIGTTLVYGRTGALNMAQIAHALDGRADRLVVVAFALIVGGFAVKAAVAPFHFWLSEAHAVAPTPLCVLFSGIMVQAGLFAIARVYWSIFSGPLGAHEPALRATLLVFGIITAYVGAGMAFGQRHLKRLLAFSTIAHSGIILCGFALFTPLGLAGMWLYILGHGFVKGVLFMFSGIVLHRYLTVDLEALRGKLRDYWWLPAGIAVGALELAGLPPLGTWVGHGVLDEAFKEGGFAWLGPLLLIPAAMTGGAVLAAAARMTFGWGPPYEGDVQSPTAETPETSAPGTFPGVMLGTSLAMLAGSFAVGLAAGAAPLAIGASHAFADRTAQIAVVLGGRNGTALHAAAAPSLASAWTSGAVSAALAVVLAAFSLVRHRLPGRAAAKRATKPLLRLAHEIHSGKVTDYVAWLAAGTAALGIAFAAGVR